MSYIAQFKQPDGSYRLPDGQEFFGDDAGIELIQSVVFNHCCCGSPEASLAYLRDVLQLLSNYTDRHAEEAKEALENFFYSEGEKYTAYYVLSRADLTEHGGSVPGWLTPMGRGVLIDLHALLAEGE